MESRFGHDFSQVRIHDDEKAAEAASAVNARAFTVGRQIVFGRAQYAPHTSAGRSLLAHELVHVVQQKDAASSAKGVGIDDNDTAEREADNAMLGVDSAPGLRSAPSPRPVSLQRKIIVSNPGKLIPNPGRKGVSQTNAATVSAYLEQLCSAEKPKVDATTGEVMMSSAFCTVPPGSSGGPAPAETATTKTGCTCLCDLGSSKNLWTIKINDADWPHTDFDKPKAASGKKRGGSGGVVTTISPNSGKIYGVADVSGKKVDSDPWLVLGHELCGHAWLGDSGQSETAHVKKTVGRQPFTIDRENALRAEHNLELRGRSFRDPYCGESYKRVKAAKPGTGNFDHQELAICKRARSRCKKPDGSGFKIDERIPDDAAC